MVCLQETKIDKIDTILFIVYGEVHLRIGLLWMQLILLGVCCCFGIEGCWRNLIRGWVGSWYRLCLSVLKMALNGCVRLE